MTDTEAKIAETGESNQSISLGAREPDACYPLLRDGEPALATTAAVIADDLPGDSAAVYGEWYLLQTDFDHVFAVASRAFCGGESLTVYRTLRLSGSIDSEGVVNTVGSHVETIEREIAASGGDA